MELHGVFRQGPIHLDTLDGRECGKSEKSQQWFRHTSERGRRAGHSHGPCFSRIRQASVKLSHPLFWGRFGGLPAPPHTKS